MQSLKIAMSETTNPMKDSDISPTRYVQNWSRSSQLSMRLSTGRNVSRNPLVYSGESGLNMHVELSPPTSERVERERERGEEKTRINQYNIVKCMVKGHYILSYTDTVFPKIAYTVSYTSAVNLLIL